jgi:hypothetical protein
MVAELLVGGAELFGKRRPLADVWARFCGGGAWGTTWSNYSRRVEQPRRFASLLERSFAGLPFGSFWYHGDHR